jgi:hypothetical protein
MALGRVAPTPVPPDLALQLSSWRGITVSYEAIGQW